MGTGKIHILDRQKISPWGLWFLPEPPPQWANFPCTFCVIEITHGHGNLIWPHISQTARQIKKLKPLYEVKLLILLTGAHFLCKIPMFWLFSRNFFLVISFCCSQNVWECRLRDFKRERARAHARAHSRLPSFFSLNRHTGKHAKCTLRAWRAFVFGTFLIDDAISTKISDPEILKHQCSSFHPMSVDFR